ncbi:MAG: pilus assembly protein PilM [Kiritimatiellae bacterium]|nr:pilus assembly protein PilM [Kiritimatiellia bacterium]
MKSIKELVQRLRGGPSDLVGIEIQEKAVFAVRMRRRGSEFSILAADSLPPAERTELAHTYSSGTIPLKLRAKYAALAIPDDTAIIKLLTFPGRLDPAAEAKIVQDMGLENANGYRISYKLVSEGRGRAESRVLAVAIPEATVEAYARFVSVGRPATYSVEVASLAKLTSFLNGPGGQHPTKCIGTLTFGDNTSCLAIFNNAIPALVRTFKIGTNHILEKIEKVFGVDRPTAEAVLAEGAIDISQTVAEVLDPLVKQLTVSRDFVERREDCRLERMFISGTVTISHDVIEQVRATVGVPVESWNPFASVSAPEGTCPENLKGQEWRFAAAIGACLGVFEAK